MDDDYDVTDGMPHLDEHGIHDVESSQQTKKLVIGRGSLRLRSVSPQEDDDNTSTEESDVDPRCMEPNESMTLQSMFGLSISQIPWALRCKDAGRSACPRLNVSAQSAESTESSSPPSPIFRPVHSVRLDLPICPVCPICPVR